MAAYTCLFGTVSLPLSVSRLRPEPTAPEVTNIISTFFRFSREICSARCRKTRSSSVPSSFERTFVPTFTTIRLYIRGRKLRPVLPAFEILFLFGRKFVDFHTHCSEFERRNFPFHLFGNVVHAGSERLLLCRHPRAAERLRRKAHVHHARGMTFGGGEIHEAAFRENADALFADDVFLNILTHHLRLAACHFLQVVEINL